MIDDTLSSLSNIRSRVRRLCRMPSEEQLTNDNLDNYINEYVLYDLPLNVSSEALSKTYSFYTSRHKELYNTNSTDPNDPLYNLKNKVIYSYSSVYINGSQARVFKSKDEFDYIWKEQFSEYSIGTGDGVTNSFSGTLEEYPVNPGSVVISSVNTSGSSIYLIDDDGDLVYDGATYGTIDYSDGTYSFNMPSVPGNGEDIIIRADFYTAGVPTDILCFNGYFKLRPIPDGVYKVDVDVYMRPTELLSTGDVPELAQLSTLIAYGAAIKILSDNADSEMIAALFPEYNRQLTLVNRRKILNNKGRRTSTIFSGGIDFRDEYF